MDLHYILLLCFVAFFAIVIIVVVILDRGRRRNEASFFADLRSAGASGAGRNLLLAVGAHRVRTSYTAGSKNSPGRLTLTTEVSGPGSFEVAREGAADAFFEGLGLESKIKSGDPDFDARFHVAADDEAFAAAYFAVAEKREAVRGLFGAGCSRVALDDSGLKAVWTPFSFSEIASAGFIKQSLPLLAALAEDLPPAQFSPESGPSRAGVDSLFKSGVGVLLLVLLVIPLAMRGGAYAPLDPGKVLVSAMIHGAEGLVVVLAAAAAILKGKSYFASAMGKVLVFAAMAAAIGGNGVELWVNAKFDEGAAEPHSVLVVRKYQTHGKHAAPYAVTPSWRPGRQTETFRIKWDQYAAISPGLTQAQVVTKPGYLGHEWIAELSFSAPQK